MGKKKVVLDQFDFIRAIACLGIVLYHFAVEYGWPDIFNNYVGGVTYGDIYVTVFFSTFSVFNKKHTCIKTNQTGW